MVHDDDFVATCLSQHLEWFHQELEKTVPGVVGLDPAKGDAQEVRALNRVLRIDGGGVRYEADPHAMPRSCMPNCMPPACQLHAEEWSALRHMDCAI